ncbi:MAG: sensor histidine kinase [Lachnospiraceae bacterium]|nr:sensor histidine kinase [Lachnospiraceae bacterium]
MIDDTDLCNVIGNLLENAITACADVTVEKRFKFPNFYQHNFLFYVTIQSSFQTGGNEHATAIYSFLRGIPSEKGR